MRVFTFNFNGISETIEASNEDNLRTEVITLLGEKGMMEEDLGIFTDLTIKEIGEKIEQIWEDSNPEAEAEDCDEDGYCDEEGCREPREESEDLNLTGMPGMRVSLGGMSIQTNSMDNGEISVQISGMRKKAQGNY